MNKIYLVQDTKNHKMIVSTELKKAIEIAVDADWFEKIYSIEQGYYDIPAKIYGNDWKNVIVNMDIEDINEILYKQGIFFYAVDSNDIFDIEKGGAY